jgi:cytochrome c
MVFKLKPAHILLAIGALVFCSFSVKNSNADKPKVLVFSKTKGWHHTSIPFGIALVQKLGAQDGYDVDTTTNAALFTDANLKQYRAVIFMSTTGNVLNGVQQAAFERYIQAGGGYAGVHSAADTEYEWPWYGKLVGAYFDSHPNAPNVRTAVVDVTDKDHPASSHLPDHWKRTDEWYNYKSIYPDIKVLAYLDESSYEGGINGTNHPIAWYHQYDGGRSFYTGCGHTDESYSDPLFIKHLEGGIKYAMGDGKALDYSRSYAKEMPEENRFVKTILTTNLNSPMELAVANDGRVFFTQLFGELSEFNTKTNQFKLIYKMPISNIGGTGLIGITLDPNFATNNYMYLYYAPAGQTEEGLHFQLSRFTLSGGQLDLESEKVMLKVPVQKNSGSHHGGSLAWDAKGNLFLSTGDSSSPFPSNGYSPLDERPGKEFYSLDSQRGAGNTNDFKGKILRIHPEADGTYTIPDGNLFPKGTAKTLPEIYVMGARNPYRIAINKRTSVLYWGEIGPDAGNDSPRGPRGYDEFNQAKKAGNYGWPYFVGNNFAYSKWDFATDTPGPMFNPQAPVNNSPNNTGLNQLPPAQAPMVWYPYAASEQFPEYGVGGRCAIGGDVYNYNPKSVSPGKFPDYYDGAFFIADWMRNWIMDMRFDANENYTRTEPFMPVNGDFRRPIDMAFGSDGILYVLEYGSVYGVANKDARLAKISYNRGNRAPIAKASIVDSAILKEVNKRAYLTSDGKNIPQIKTISGQAPLKVNLTGKGSKDMDDDDRITYQWLFDGKTPGAKTSDATYTYKTPGTYKAILKVTDKAGLVGRDTLIIKVGNTAPVVTIAGTSNKSFYWKDKPFNYAIKVSDKEDGKIDPAKVKAFYVYHATPADFTEADVLKPSFGEVNYPGKAIMAASDCKACHQINALAVGPSFTAIANRYKADPAAEDMLAKKIIAGGGGNWGTVHVMSAHPQLSIADTKEIVKYIFSVTDKRTSTKVNIPLTGSLNLKYNDNEPRGEYTIVATYTDKGSKAVGPIRTIAINTLRHGDMNPAFTDAYVGYPRFRDKLSEGGNKAYLLLKNVDLTGISQINYNYGSRNMDGEIEVRLDSKAGPVISTTAYKQTGSFDKENTVTGKFNNPVSGRHDIYIYAVKRTKPNDAIIRINTIAFE